MINAFLIDGPAGTTKTLFLDIGVTRKIFNRTK